MVVKLIAYPLLFITVALYIFIVVRLVIDMRWDWLREDSNGTD